MNLTNGLLEFYYSDKVYMTLYINVYPDHMSDLHETIEGALYKQHPGCITFMPLAHSYYQDRLKNN